MSKGQDKGKARGADADDSAPAPARDSSTRKAPAGDPPKATGFAAGTMLVAFNMKLIDVKDLVEGDLLLGIDGKPRRVLFTTSGKARLATITLKIPGAVRAGTHEARAIRLTPDHPLHTIRFRPKKSSSVFTGGANWTDIRASFKSILDTGPSSMGPASSVAMGEDEEDLSQVHHCPSFRSAIKRGMNAVLNAKRTERNNTMFLSKISGNGHIDPHQTFFKVKVPPSTPDSVLPGFAVFAFDPKTRATAHPNYPIQFFPNKGAAYDAAVAFKRTIAEADDINFGNLRDRFEAKSNKNRARVAVHGRISGLAIVKRGASTWVEAELNVYEGDTIVESYKKRYYFDGDVGWGDDDYLPELDFGGDDPKAGESAHTVSTTTAEFLTTLERGELDRYRHIRPRSVIPFDAKDVPVDPYFLGLWLGDGSRAHSTIANKNEAEIRPVLFEQAQLWGLHVVYHGGVSYALVANSAVLDRPLPPVVTPEERGETRPDIRESRYMRDKRRLEEGWSRLQPQGPGRPILWLPPPAHRPPSSLPPSEPPSAASRRRVDDSAARATEDTVEYATGDQTAAHPAEYTVESATGDKTAAHPAEDTVESATDDPDGAPSNISAYNFMPEPQVMVNEAYDFLDRYAVPDPSPVEADDHVTEAVDNALIRMEEIQNVEVDGDDDVDVDDSDDEPEIIMRGPDGQLPRTGPAEPAAQRRRATAVGRLQRHGMTYDEDDFDEILQGMFEADDETAEDDGEGAPAPGRRVNRLCRALRDLGVMTSLTGPEADTKHIPIAYMHNSEQVRFALLAGLLDSDGSYDYGLNRFQFSQAVRWHRRLLDDVDLLLSSLGIPHTKSFIDAKDKEINGHAAHGTEAEKFTFSALPSIPTLLARKRPEPRQQESKWRYNTRSIEIGKEEEDFFGFMLDGDNMCVRSDFLILCGTRS